jgi:hypothetical protein
MHVYQVKRDVPTLTTRYVIIRVRSLHDLHSFHKQVPSRTSTVGKLRHWHRFFCASRISGRSLKETSALVATVRYFKRYIMLINSFIGEVICSHKTERSNIKNFMGN